LNLRNLGWKRTSVQRSHEIVFKKASVASDSEQKSDRVGWRRGCQQEGFQPPDVKSEVTTCHRGSYTEGRITNTKHNIPYVTLELKIRTGIVKPEHRKRCLAHEAIMNTNCASHEFTSCRDMDKNPAQCPPTFGLMVLDRTLTKSKMLQETFTSACWNGARKRSDITPPDRPYRNLYAQEYRLIRLSGY